MTEESNLPRSARRWWFVGAAAVVLAVVAGLAVSGVFGGLPVATSPVPGATPTAPTTGPASTPVPEPSIPSPTATGTPSVEPTRKPTSVRTGLDSKVETAPGVTARVTGMEAVQGEAQGPGEIAGPALRVTVTIANDSAKAIRTELGLINVYYGKDRDPAGTLSGPGVRAFPAEIPAGGSGSGTSVFNVPTNSRGDIEVEFSYSTDAPVVIFSGAA